MQENMNGIQGTRAPVNVFAFRPRRDSQAPLDLISSMLLDLMKGELREILLSNHTISLKPGQVYF